MRTTIFTIVLLAVLNVNAQQISFTFTGNYSCEYAPLDSIFIENLTQGGDTTLYWNDTVLSFVFTGIDNQIIKEQSKFSVSQNYPNPFNTKTEVDVYLPQKELLKINVFDITGKQLTSYQNTFDRGLHSFVFYAGSANTYILRVIAGLELRRIKMLQSGSSQHGFPRIEHLGTSAVYSNNNTLPELRSLKSFFPYEIGDELKFTGFINGEFEEIIDAPQASENYLFDIAVVFPDMPQSEEHIPEEYQIIWNWTSVPDVLGYKYNTENNFATATDIGNNTSFTQENLKCNTEHTLYVWAYNLCGSSEVLELSSETLDPNISFICGDNYIDCRDANVYTTVQIGDQCWMAENLKYLPVVNNLQQWQIYGALSEPAYGVYGYGGFNLEEAKQHENYAIYGVLYNWWAAMDGAESSSTNPSGVQGACPPGWHLPSDNEWKQLEMELGMSEEEADESGWRGTNEGSKLAGNENLWENDLLVNDPEFDSSGFNALPAGLRSDFGSVNHLGSQINMWCTHAGENNARYRRISYDSCKILRGVLNKKSGVSVRCLKD